jgi:hypothetical protein
MKKEQQSFNEFHVISSNLFQQLSKALSFTYITHNTIKSLGELKK